MIKGKLIDLQPATLDDRRKVYDWCFHSEITKSHAGQPDYPDVHIPSYDEFYNDYLDYFFIGQELNKGRGSMIMQNNTAIGFISYTSFHLKPHWAELDIWMCSEDNCGKGYGTDAIISLGNFICDTQNITKQIMRPALKNTRAITSYKKAGFEESNIPPTDYLLKEYITLYADGDYGSGNTALLLKTC